MNAKAAELGLTSTRFANAHGLPDPAQRSTAQDLARLTGRLLAGLPGVAPLLGGASFVYRGRVYSPQHPALPRPGRRAGAQDRLHARGGLQPGRRRVARGRAFSPDRAGRADAQPLVPRRAHGARATASTRPASRSRRRGAATRRHGCRRAGPPTGAHAAALRLTAPPAAASCRRAAPASAHDGAPGLPLRCLRHPVRRPLGDRGRAAPSRPIPRRSRRSGARSSSSTRGSVRSWVATRTSGR